MSELEQIIRRLVEEALKDEDAPRPDAPPAARREAAAEAPRRAEPARPPRRTTKEDRWRPRRPPARTTPQHLAGRIAERPEPHAASPYDSKVERTWTVGLEEPRNPPFFERIVASTPSRIGTGRAGTRYRTATYLELRTDHAVAKDAVYAEVPEGFAAQLGCIEVVSRCPDREHYLLHPNDGRRLSPDSRALLERDGTRGADVQIIVADGLAAPALLLNGPRLLPALESALAARGLSTGRPILAHMARVGLQDDIGVLLGARATLICVGERPGLGTGDSLSIYLTVGPALDQDNADKNCISNIRPAGLSPERSADMAADLLARGLAIGKSGLVLSSGEGA